MIVARMTATMVAGIISHKTRRLAALTFPSSTDPSLTQERDDLLDLPDVLAEDTAAASAAARDYRPEGPYGFQVRRRYVWYRPWMAVVCSALGTRIRNSSAGVRTPSAQ